MEDSKKLLEKLQTTDPTIIIKGDTIELSPCYLNINLIFDFTLLFACVLILFNNEILIGFIGILVSLFLIGDFFRQNNKMIVDIKNKCLLIIPNFISSRFLKDFKKINFTNIKNVTTTTAYSNTVIFQRFAIIIELSNSEEAKIITIGNQKTAEVITNVLKRLS